MNISTHVKRLVVLLVAATTAAPVALANTPSLSGGDVGQSANVPTAQCPCNVGLPPASAGLTPFGTARLSSTSTSGCPCNVGLPGGRLTIEPAVLAKTNVTTPETAGSTSRSQCPCNTGLVNGPLIVRPVDHAPTVISTSAGSFDWRDAGAGAGFTAAIGLLATGAALMLRRHRLPAQPHS